MEVKVGVSVIIINKKGQVLVGKRKGSHGEGMLSVPGGHLEYLESIKNTCDRELLEEIGVIPEGEYMSIGLSEDIFDDNTGTKQFEAKLHYITLYFVIDNVDSDKLEVKNMEPDKCESWDWVDISDLPNNMFCDTYNKIREHFLSQYL